MEFTVEKIQSQIVDIPLRPPAMLDSAISGFYGVKTREVNQAVSRNPKKFPPDFCFQLTMDEVEFVRKNRSQIVIKYAGEKVRPRAFTREGCNMLATILGSDIAIDRCIQIIRVFSSMETECVRRRRGIPESEVLKFGLRRYFTQTYSWDEIPCEWKDIRKVKATFLINDSIHHKETAKQYNLESGYIIIPAYGSQEDSNDPLLWVKQIHNHIEKYEKLKQA